MIIPSGLFTDKDGYFLCSDKKTYYKFYLEQVDKAIRKDRIAKTIIKKGDLVFDIGANQGNKTALFISLGAKVIAVEPLLGVSSDLVAELLRFSDDENVTFIPLAVSDKEEVVSFTIQKNAPYLSSLDNGWMTKGRLSHWFSEDRTETKNIACTTLDKLIETYGVPRYIKIDTEGHDDIVLQGLSKTVDYISFEIQPGSFDRMDNALERIRQIAGYWEKVKFFTYTLDNTGEFAIEWTNDSIDFAKLVRESVTGEHWADVYVRMV